MSWFRHCLHRLIQGHGQMATGTASIQNKMSPPNLVQLCLGILINITRKNRVMSRTRRKWNRANHGKESKQITLCKRII